MTVYQCSCGEVHSSDGPPCPQTFQVQYQIPGMEPFPLAIIRGSRFHDRRQRGRSAGPVGHFNTCAIVDDDGRDYLTACGDVVRKGSHSVWEKVTCPACRRALALISDLHSGGVGPSEQKVGCVGS